MLAGEAGISRKVKRVSVFDYPCNKEILNRNTLTSGDLFITCLEQFQVDKDGIYDYINALIMTDSSGLLVVTDEHIGIITKDIEKICNENDFPLILIKDDLPYAVIMDTVNQYIAIENLNVINTLKLDKIMYGSISNNEKMEILHSIKPNIAQYVRTIYVDGEFNSEIAELKAHTSYLNNVSDIFVRNNNYKVFILSADNSKKLKHHSDAAAAQIKEFVNNPRVGFSRIYTRRDIGKALEEGKCSLETAKTMNMDFQEYDPLSVMQLLVSVRDTQEAQDFYEAYVNAVKEKVSGENLREVLLTMETYVANSGDYKVTAKVMSQHENTIRYRVNKVKCALNMENDNIKFNETIAIAVKLRILMNKTL
ncbi:PucR family transcriptional regulator [Aminipila terrae]|uniref:PucR family transcriptional regulator n=1 Tax=Aminipila terrae TaxID=2697030 RepID=UPI002ED394F8